VITWLYCAVEFAQIVAAPVISIIEFTKLELAPVLAKLVNVPLEALETVFIADAIEVLSPPETPWLKL
jgi:hypothetical protein